MEISKLLNTGLDTESLAVCVKLCEAGVNPEALASVVQELRREAGALQVIIAQLSPLLFFLGGGGGVIKLKVFVLLKGVRMESQYCYSCRCHRETAHVPLP